MLMSKCSSASAAEAEPKRRVAATATLNLLIMMFPRACVCLGKPPQTLWVRLPSPVHRRARRDQARQQSGCEMPLTNRVDSAWLSPGSGLLAFYAGRIFSRRGEGRRSRQRRPGQERASDGRDHHAPEEGHRRQGNHVLLGVRSVGARREGRRQTAPVDLELIRLTSRMDSIANIYFSVCFASAIVHSCEAE